MNKGLGLGAYSDMNDEAVVVLAQNGDSCALDFILKKYSSSVKRISRRYFLIGADHDDIVQEGMIGLFKAVHSYSPEKNTSFKSFADLCVTRSILSAIKGATRQKHRPLNSYVSLDSPIYENGGELTLGNVIGRDETVNPEEIIIRREKLNSIGDRIVRFLSKLECQVLTCYLRGESYSDIAERLEKDPKAIDNALQRIRRKFEKIVAEDGGDN